MAYPIRLFVAGDPVPQGSKKAFARAVRHGRCKCGGHNVKCRSCVGTGWKLGIHVNMLESSKRLKGWRETVGIEAKQDRARALGSRTPLHVVAVFAFRRPPSHYGKTGLTRAGREFPGPQGKSSHGDVDKLVRAINDGLAGTLFDDDADIVSEVGLKVWTNGQPGAYLSVSPFGAEGGETKWTLLEAFGMGLIGRHESLTIGRTRDVAHHERNAIISVDVEVGDWTAWFGGLQGELLPPDDQEDIPFS